jgi:hypothetical protein
MDRVHISFILIMILLLSGCAGLEAPTPERFIPPWSGASALNLGDSKEHVRDQWGEPERINYLGVDEVGLIKEEWIYEGRKLPVIEIEPKMLVKGKNLVFTGHALTGYKAKDE